MKIGASRMSFRMLVVQRLPIRISIDPDQPLAPRLRPGMSVIVKVDTGAEGREPAEATP